MSKLLRVAQRHLNVREVPGTPSNPLILAWAAADRIPNYRNDGTPWCAVAVGGWNRECGWPGTGSALARSYLRWGIELPHCVPGAVVVFPRGDSDWQGHVGVVEKVHDNGTITIISGNDGNMVRRSVRMIDDIIPGGIRWPMGEEIIIDRPLPKPKPTAPVTAKDKVATAVAATAATGGVVGIASTGAGHVGTGLAIGLMAVIVAAIVAAVVIAKAIKKD